MKRFILLLLNVGSVYSIEAQNTGIGTINPTDKLHISAPAGENGLRVQIGGVTKLRVWNNGGVSIGSPILPPPNGLYTQGPIRADSGIYSSDKMMIESTGDSVVINVGTSKITIAPNGNIVIKSATKITIDAATDLELKAVNISLTAQNNLSLQASGVVGITGSMMNLNANPIRFNNGTRKISGIGDLVNCPADGGTVPILTGSPNVFTN